MPNALYILLPVLIHNVQIIRFHINSSENMTDNFILCWYQMIPDQNCINVKLFWTKIIVYNLQLWHMICMDGVAVDIVTCLD